jgi:hypothetical protein
MWTFQPPAPTKTLTEKVIDAATSIVGQQETPNNSGFKDAEFEKRMKDVGWRIGESWCVYTAELIWKTAFTTAHPLYPLINKLFSGSAMITWANFVKDTTFKKGKLPQPGAICIFQHGKGWQGHAGIVTSIGSGSLFNTIEGNTNAAGGREGIEVATKQRFINLPYSERGLNLVGFIYLPG